VLEDKAEDVYHRPHSKTKRKLEDEWEDVIEGRPVTKDLADRLLENGTRRKTRWGSAANDELKLLATLWTHDLSLVQTGLYIGSRPACSPHPSSVSCDERDRLSNEWRGGGGIAGDYWLNESIQKGNLKNSLNCNDQRCCAGFLC